MRDELAPVRAVHSQLAAQQNLLKAEVEARPFSLVQLRDGAYDGGRAGITVHDTTFDEGIKPLEAARLRASAEVSRETSRIVSLKPRL